MPSPNDLRYKFLIKTRIPFSHLQHHQRRQAARHMQQLNHSTHMGMQQEKAAGAGLEGVGMGVGMGVGVAGSLLAGQPGSLVAGDDGGGGVDDDAGNDSGNEDDEEASGSEDDEESEAEIHMLASR
jgi:hypothetical protein